MDVQFDHGAPSLLAVRLHGAARVWVSWRHLMSGVGASRLVPERPDRCLHRSDGRWLCSMDRSPHYLADPLEFRVLRSISIEKAEERMSPRSGG